ncbi:MAG: T9SS type A sorting domain-containing protein [Bacteroidota bacterium]
MKKIIPNGLLLLGGLMLTGLISLQAQLQVPGKVLGDYGRMKATDVVYLLPPLDPLEEDALRQSGQKAYYYSKSLEFALERPVSLAPDRNGAWIREGDQRVWRVHIISPGAYSLGLMFDRYHLEKDVKVMIYDPELLHIKGAYTNLNNKSSGILAVGHVPGQEVIIELQVPDHVDYYGELSLGSVSHAFMETGELASRSYCAGEFGCSEDCEIDVNCAEGADWQTEKRSVVRLYTLTQYCTGVLINNTAYNGDPLILTAKHCIDQNVIAQRTVFEFNYESPSCFGEDGPLDMSISGAELLASGDSIDFCLVRLSVTPPDAYNACYAGWDLEESQTTGSTTIHHPQGDVKKISFDFRAPSSTTRPEDVDPEFVDYLYYSFWWIRKWDVGSTEPGSSGSPLINEDKKVTGLLSWGAARCGDSIGYDAEKERVIFSTTVNRDDYFTKLYVAWDHNRESNRSLKPWLDPVGSGQSSLDGYEPVSTDPVLSVPGSHFRVYPNPAGEFLYFSTDHSGHDQAEFMVYDMSGAIRLTGRSDSQGPGRIDIRSLDHGIYLLQIETGFGRETHKFVISP